MITSPIVINDLTARVKSVDLLPRFNDWREHTDTLGQPPLGYRVKLALPLPDGHVVTGTLWIPTEYVETDDGDITVAATGLESGTAPIPKVDATAATPKVHSDQVVIGDDGYPEVAASEPEGTGHWAVCRFIPTKGGAALKLSGVTVAPKRVPSGPLKDTFATDKNGSQVVSVYAEDWEATQVATKAATAAPIPMRSAAKTGAHVPEWAKATA